MANGTDAENFMKIKDCENNANVRGGAVVGGVTGYGNNNGAIKECTNSGKVEANQAHRWNRAGGIVGWYRSRFERKTNRKM